MRSGRPPPIARADRPLRSESDQFVQAVRERGGTVEYLRFPDEGHSIRKLSNRVITYRRAADFLERWLAPEAATAAQVD